MQATFYVIFFYIYIFLQAFNFIQWFYFSNFLFSRIINTNKKDWKLGSKEYYDDF